MWQRFQRRSSAVSDPVGGNVASVRYWSVGNSKREAESGCVYRRRIGVVAFAVGAAADVQVDAQIAGAVALDELFHDLPPAALVRVRAYFQRIQAVTHALHVRAESHQPPGIRGNHLVNSVAEQEAAVHRRDAGFAHRKKFTIKVYGCHCMSASVGGLNAALRSAVAVVR